MPALSNPKYERFAQQLAEGVAQHKAYSASGYTSHNPAARACSSRLLKTARIILARVQELQRQGAKHVEVTVQTIASELDEARAIAREQKQGAAMTAASLGKAKILGLEPPTKTELGGPGDFRVAQSTSELAEKFLRALNPSLVEVSDEAQQAFIEEMRRHEAVVEAIAYGNTDGMQH